MSQRIFISYRRSDTQMAAGRLGDALLMEFGPGTVFRDKEAIGPGHDWLEEVHRVLAANVVVLALIGRTWADARDSEGRRRLDDPQDTNRLELETALSKGLRLLPILVEGADIPPASSLPASLAPLTRRNAIRLRDDDWQADFSRLVDALRRDGLAPAGAAAVRNRRAAHWATTWVVACSLAGAALLGGAHWLSSRGSAASGLQKAAELPSSRGDSLLGVWEQWVIEPDGNLSPRGAFIVSRSGGRYIMSALNQREDAIHSNGISDVEYDEQSRTWTFRSDWGGGRIALFTLNRASDNVFEGVSSLNSVLIQRERWIKRSGA